ncbi:MAG: C-GCAxxG-C-C family protein [Bacteroidales bacterium]|nr:C-GCAxxG-C-C family protein [Bacteroidales bacterium]
MSLSFPELPRGHAAYADIAGIDEETAMRLAAPFGAGMGNMEGTCGAITGAGLVLMPLSFWKNKSLGAHRTDRATFASGVVKHVVAARTKVEVPRVVRADGI